MSRVAWVGTALSFGFVIQVAESRLLSDDMRFRVPPNPPRGIMAIMSETWIHKKTGNEYTKTGEAFDCTNGLENRVVVLYQREVDQIMMHFVRDKLEFEEKFVPNFTAL